MCAFVCVRACACACACVLLMISGYLTLGNDTLWIGSSAVTLLTTDDLWVDPEGMNNFMFNQNSSSLKYRFGITVQGTATIVVVVVSIETR